MQVQYLWNLWSLHVNCFRYERPHSDYIDKLPKGKHSCKGKSNSFTDYQGSSLELNNGFFLVKVYKALVCFFPVNFYIHYCSRPIGPIHRTLSHCILGWSWFYFHQMGWKDDIPKGYNLKKTIENGFVENLFIKKEWVQIRYQLWRVLLHQMDCSVLD